MSSGRCSSSISISISISSSIIFSSRMLALMD